MTNKPMLSVERDLIERAIQAIINTSQMQPALNELRALLDAEKVNNREMGLMQYVDAHPIKPSAQQQGYPVPGYKAYETQPAESLAGMAARQLKDEKRWVEIRNANAFEFPDMGPHDYYPCGSIIRIPAEQLSDLENQRDRFEFQCAKRMEVPVEDVAALRDGITYTLHAVASHYRTFQAAEQPAPVAILPFADKVIAKLQRFEACASDGQDVDIGRHWFDVLTQLELLRRVQRSPAYWEMTQQGQDVLEATRLNSPL